LLFVDILFDGLYLTVIHCFCFTKCLLFLELALVKDCLVENEVKQQLLLQFVNILANFFHSCRVEVKVCRDFLNSEPAARADWVFFRAVALPAGPASQAGAVVALSNLYSLLLDSIFAKLEVRDWKVFTNCANHLLSLFFDVRIFTFKIYNHVRCDLYFFHLFDHQVFLESIKDVLTHFIVSQDLTLWTGVWPFIRVDLIRIWFLWFRWLNNL
jgi:hypothetical protein